MDMQHFTSMAQGETLLDTGHDVRLVMVTKGFITTVTVAVFRHRKKNDQDVSLSPIKVA